MNYLQYTVDKGGNMKLSTVTLILRGYNFKQVDCVADVLLKSKYIRNLEVTLNTENALDIIEKIATKYSDNLNIGAGSVLTLKDLKSAISKGAKFILSPCIMSQEMLDYCHKNKVISISGALSPSEIYHTYSQGSDIVKVFPANEYSKQYAKKVIEPLGNIPLMAVGGINKDNVKEYLNGGYQYVGSANGIFNKEDILLMNKEKLLKQLAEFEQALS